jgi:hypothetical protein
VRVDSGVVLGQSLFEIGASTVFLGDVHGPFLLPPARTCHVRCAWGIHGLVTISVITIAVTPA